MKRINDDTPMKKVVRLLTSHPVKADRLLENYLLERVDGLVVGVAHSSGQPQERADGDLCAIAEHAGE